MGSRARKRTPRLGPMWMGAHQRDLLVSYNKVGDA
jgi:hypothetical protein